MSARTAVAGWVLAALFAAATALLAWQYTEVRRSANKIQQDYESLQLRVEEQARQNTEFDATLKSLSQQLEEARSALETLDRAVKSVPESPPAQP